MKTQAGTIFIITRTVGSPYTYNVKLVYLFSEITIDIQLAFFIYYIIWITHNKGKSTL